MNVIVVNASRNSFEDKKGNEVKYCKFTCLVAGKESENFNGYNLETFTTQYDNYETISSFVKSGKSVNLELDFSKIPNSTYYRTKPIKIGELDL